MSLEGHDGLMGVVEGSLVSGHGHGHRQREKKNMTRICPETIDLYL